MLISMVEHFILYIWTKIRILLFSTLLSKKEDTIERRNRKKKFTVFFLGVQIQIQNISHHRKTPSLDVNNRICTAWYQSHFGSAYIPSNHPKTNGQKDILDWDYFRRNFLPPQIKPCNVNTILSLTTYKFLCLVNAAWVMLLPLRLVADIVLESRVAIMSRQIMFIKRLSSINQS